MALSKVTYVDGVTIIGAKNLNDIQDELIRQGEQQTEDEAELALKANAADVETALALKADKSDTYTKAEVNEALDLKANTADVTASLELKADKTETYTKGQVDGMVEDAIAEAVKESEYSNFEMKSVSGDFIHITDGAGLIPVKDLKIGIDAVQDLHGYDAPWVGGAGKNKLPPILYGEVSSIESNGVTMTIENQKFKFTGTCSSGGGRLTLRTINFDLPAGTYIISSDYTGSYLPAFIQDQNNNILARTGGGGSNTVTLSETTSVFIGFNLTEGQVYNTTTTVMVHKSTDTDTWQPYSNICPISGWTGAKVTVQGINQWDEEWEVGEINGSTGANANTGVAIRSKNYIPAINTNEYYFKIGYTSCTIYQYSSEDVSGYIGAIYGKANSTFSLASNCNYIRFATGTGYGTTYNHDISINYPSTDTDYHAFDGKTYEVTWQTEAGTVYGGTLDVTTGVLTITKMGFDMGSLTWQVANGGATPSKKRMFTGSLVGVCVGSPSGSDVSDILCSCYQPMSANNSYSDTRNGIALAAGGNLYVNDDAYESATTVTDFVASVTGQTLVAPLATPQTYQLIPKEVLTLLGENNIFADTGAIEELIYRISRQA